MKPCTYYDYDEAAARDRRAWPVHDCAMQCAACGFNPSVADKRLNEKRIHPMQKPVALYNWIFRQYAQPGFKILDTHLGSGSSRIAAWDAGLDFWGYEINKVYFDLQEERFVKHSAQINLFLDSTT